jgi:hypothetical protein
MDRAQWSYWAAGKNWTAAERARDGDLVDDIKAVVQPEDPILHYSTLGNVFLGTMLPNYLTTWGIRTLLISGYHLPIHCCGCRSARRWKRKRGRPAVYDVRHHVGL